MLRPRVWVETSRSEIVPHIGPYKTLGHPLEGNCCCPTNLCAWRPNIVYKNRSVCRHQHLRLPRRLKWRFPTPSPRIQWVLLRRLIQARGRSISLPYNFPPILLSCSLEHCLDPIHFTYAINQTHTAMIPTS